VCGIAGGFPEGKFSPGGVILTKHLYDTRVGAFASSDRTNAVRGGSFHRDLTELCNFLAMHSG